MTHTRFDDLSPLDYRFIGGDQKLHKELAPFLSPAAVVRYQARVEGALALAMADAKIFDRALADEIASAADQVTPQEVAEEEATTHHDVRALVNVIRAHVSDEAKRYVHLAATSYDVVDTANSLRYRECCERVIIPALARLVARCIAIAEAEAYNEATANAHSAATSYDARDTANSFRHRACGERVIIPAVARPAARCIAIAEAEADTPPIGRTLGRHAEPITFGFAIAQYVSRLGDRTQALAAVAKRLPGKLSGAVGAYNAMELVAATSPRALEKRFLKSLGLDPRPISTQIVEHEPWSDL